MPDEINLDTAPKSSTLPQTLGADLSGLYQSIYKKSDDEAQKAKEAYATEAGEIGVQKAKLKAGPVQEYANKYADISKKYEPELMAKAPEFKVDQNTASGIASMAALLPIAGALFGGKGQMSGIGALQAMDGVLKGYQSGNQQRIEFEKAKFEKELQNFKMHQDQIQKAFDRAVQGAKVNLTAATARLESDLAAMDAKNVQAMVRRDGIVGGQTGYHNLIDPIAKELAKNLPSVMSVGGVTQGVGPQAALARMLDPQTASKTTEANAKKAVESVTSAKAGIDMINMAKNPAIKFGEVGTAQQNVYSALRRNILNLKDNASDQEVNQVINNVARSYKLSENDENILFYKKAIFSALEMERAARGGSVLPVAFMKSLTPLLDPKRNTKEGWIAIFEDQINKVASQSTLTPEQFSRAIRNTPTFNVMGTVGKTSVPPSAPPAVSTETDTGGWSIKEK